MARPRKSLEPVIADEVLPPVSNTITNTRKGFTLHLGDGRTLEYGESVEVDPADVEFLQGVING